MKTRLLCLLAVFGFQVAAQEICDNGLDDDNDGLFDIQDPDCNCSGATSSITADFEEFSCCPQTQNALNCLNDGWTAVGVGTVDYYNTCGYLGGIFTPAIPQPIPSGNGAIGVLSFINSNVDEGVARCLDCSFIAGESYDFSIFIGFADGITFDSPDVEFALYGKSDCSNIPSSGNGCIGEDGWTQLVAFQVDAVANSWVPVTGSFTSPGDFSAIAFGKSCDFLNHSTTPNTYHFMDNLEITGNFNGSSCGGSPAINASTSVSGNCASGYTFFADAPQATQFQWYLDGIAIPGATTNPWFADPPTSGDYQVRAISADGSCGISDPINFDPDLGTLGISSIQISPSCPGDSDGSIQLVVASPNLPLDIDWDTGDITQTLGNVGAGTYSVTVTDANGCFGEQTIVLEDPEAITSDVAIMQPTGGNGGSVSISTTGGSAPYTYNWSNGLAGPDQDNLDPGTYTVTVTDANGCEEILTILIAEAFSVGASVVDETCFGQCGGVAVLSPQGGLAPYTYSWSIPGNTDSQLDLCAGTYAYTVTDSEGTELIGTVDVQSGLQLTASIAEDGIRCDNTETTNLDLTVDNGMAPLSFSWSNGAMTEDLFNVGSGSYSVVATDALGCEITTGIFVPPVDALQLNAAITEVSCDAPTGIIIITPSGGNGSYTYQWSSGQNTNIITGPAGDYQLTVTDANGCTVENVYTIQESIQLTSTAILTQPVCADDTTGAIDLTVDSGTAPFTFSWSNSETTEDVFNLSSGDYTVTITDGSNCEAVSTFTIASTSSVDVQAMIDEVSCPGGNDGAVNLTTSGSLLPLTYNWSTGSDSTAITDLGAGTYELTITDAAGCVYESSYTITEPDEFTVDSLITLNDCFGGSAASIELLPPTTGTFTAEWNTTDTGLSLTDLQAGDYTVTITNDLGCEQTYDFSLTDENPALDFMADQVSASCGETNGSLTLSPSGGLGPYTYNWETGDNEPSINGQASGSYAFTITDALGCTLESQATIGEETTAAVASSVVEPTCVDAENGSISLDLSGSGPFTVDWSNGEIGTDIANLGAGQISVTIVDANGCTITRDFDLQPTSSLDLDALVKDVTCFSGTNGSVTTTSAASLPPLIYEWSNNVVTPNLTDVAAGIYELTITDAAGCEYESSYAINEPDAFVIDSIITLNDCSGGSAASIEIVPPATGTFTADWSTSDTGLSLTGLSAGNYSVIVTSELGCEQAYNFAIVDEVEPILIDLTVEDPTCTFENGSISASVDGGNGPFTFDWGTAGSGADLTDLGDGDYALLVTDQTGCTATIDTFLAPYPQLTNSSNLEEPLCAGDVTGSISLMPDGGTAPYTYSWSNSATEPEIEGLTADDYEVTITDALGCELVESFTINEPPPLQLDQIVTQPLCFGDLGSVVFGPSGGSGTYTFSGDLTGAALTYDLPAGDYNFELLDENNCSLPAQLQIVEPEELSSDVISTTNPDLGVENGQISAEASGGTPPYIFEWSNGDTGAEIDGLGPGTYTAVVTDANGCQTTISATLEQSAPLSFALGSTDNLCAGTCTGTISLQLAGGTAPYTVSWSDGGSGPVRSDLCNGEYRAEITDANGNSIITDFVTITSPEALEVVSSNAASVSCIDASDGQIAVEIAGGTAPFNYNWNGNPGGPIVSNLGVGTYELNLVDANNCLFIETFTVEDYEVREFGFSSAVTNCDFDAYEIVIFDPQLDEVDWLLNGERAAVDASGVVRNLPPGSYELSYEEASGCRVAVETFAFDGLAPYQILLDESPREVEFGDAVELEVLASPLDQLEREGMVSWSSINAFACVDGTPENCGIIELIAESSEVVEFSYRDDRGCLSEFRIPIFVAQPEYAYIPSAFSPNEDGVNDDLLLFTNDFVEAISIARFYDRWGNMVSEATDLRPGEAALWDGRIGGQNAQVGVYVYAISLRLATGEEVVLSGDVTLVR
ncbi:MAG: gliding motility-associated C-terminal domain-containing protein [Bacteroidota bacterium]